MSDQKEPEPIFLITHHYPLLPPYFFSAGPVLAAGRGRLPRGQARSEARGDLGGELRVFDRDDLPALAVAPHRELDGALARLERDARRVATLLDRRSLTHAE